jgi:Domain of unknown function (DUF4157)
MRANHLSESGISGMNDRAEPMARVAGKQTLTESLVQRKESGTATSDDVHSAAQQGISGSGSSLPFASIIQRSFGGHDVGGIQAHTDQAARHANEEIGAQAFATGNHVAFRGSPDLHTAAHEAAHVVQQRAGVYMKGGVGEAGDQYERHADAVADKVVAGESAESLISDMSGAPTGATAAVQRKEVETDAEIRGVQDWTRADREGNSARWRAACLHNVNAVDSTQYVKVVERRDFYRWFYEYTASRGYTTRWALAANLVADGAHQIADMDATTLGSIGNDAAGMANVELQGAMREGNQVIFDNVLPKLKRLLDGGPLTGAAALRWDMQVLAEEQSLIQPMYARMSPQTRAQLEAIARKRGVVSIGAWVTGGDQVPAGPHNNAGTVPAFNQPDMQSVGDRWRYGMDLGNTFTPGGSGFDPATHTMPAVGTGYTDGSEFARVSTRHNLHQLDAWLNPNRVSRIRGDSGSDIQALISALTAFEKQQVLTDRSPDGWAYSTQFAQFGFITEAQVRQALPSDAASAAAVSAFVARYAAERRRVEIRYPTGGMMPFGP